MPLYTGQAVSTLCDVTKGVLSPLPDLVRDCVMYWSIGVDFPTTCSQHKKAVPMG